MDAEYSVTIVLVEVDGSPQLELSNDSSLELFQILAEVIASSLGGAWIQRVDGPEQAYWDIRINDRLFTLHREQYLGISFFPNDKTLQPEVARQMLGEFADKIVLGFSSL